MYPDKDQQAVSGPEGLTLTAELNNSVSLDVHALFKTPLGEKVLNYFKCFTTNFVHQPGTPIEVLAHREGARWLVGVIQRRIDHAEKLIHVSAVRGPDHAQ